MTEKEKIDDINKNLIPENTSYRIPAILKGKVSNKEVIEKLWEITSIDDEMLKLRNQILDLFVLKIREKNTLNVPLTDIMMLFISRTDDYSWIVNIMKIVFNENSTAENTRIINFLLKTSDSKTEKQLAQILYEKVKEGSQND